VTLILDMGSANTCKNDKRIIERMIREVGEVASDRHEVILKWQLFYNAPPNIPLTFESFRYAYTLADHLCFETTASVFDIESMRFLMGFRVPFVKIANRPDLYHLAKHSTVPVYLSSALSGFNIPNTLTLACISKYPATLEDYELSFNAEDMHHVSDHTAGWGLYRKWYPSILEKHFVHERSDSNPDAGPFAVTPKELAEVM